MIIYMITYVSSIISCHLTRGGDPTVFPPQDVWNWLDALVLIVWYLERPLGLQCFRGNWQQMPQITIELETKL